MSISNWTCFAELGVHDITAPGSYHTSVVLGPSLRLGDYMTSQRPEEPVVIQMSRHPCKPGLPRREQHQVGRQELLTTSFETFERNIRDQLGRTLSKGGFDPARDIVAITVNRLGARLRLQPSGAHRLRRSHDGSWGAAHELRDGKVWESPIEVDDNPYDLIVVGGGISRLAAAYFFRKATGPSARILILDNHDVLKELSVDLERFHSTFDKDLYRSLGLTAEMLPPPPRRQNCEGA